MFEARLARQPQLAAMHTLRMKTHQIDPTIILFLLHLEPIPLSPTKYPNF